MIILHILSLISSEPFDEVTVPLGIGVLVLIAGIAAFAIRYARRRRRHTALPTGAVLSAHSRTVTESRRAAGPAAELALRTAPRVQHIAADDFPLLRTMVMGSTATAERLIAFEQKKTPIADRETLIANAIDTLRRDRHRHG
ncbi:hypothetical protein [Nocardia goodfellowii]|uniref:Uncharacterized protein n=1 Tax=Nocardia goodfellowii TaxID=882446 RepID=A0ABS4QIK6_9NOCA|nr:hypothetical protein [Nocardia goodfellowii]MBP2191485.1 hypothetical protein [Nocardia goodfellowii]